MLTENNWIIRQVNTEVQTSPTFPQVVFYFWKPSFFFYQLSIDQREWVRDRNHNLFFFTFFSVSQTWFYSRNCWDNLQLMIYVNQTFLIFTLRLSEMFWTNIIQLLQTFQKFDVPISCLIFKVLPGICIWK